MLSLTVAQDQDSSRQLFYPPHANLLAQAQYLKHLEDNATSEEGKARLKEERLLCGNSFLKRAIAFYDWFTEQSSELIEKLYAFHPYVSTTTLLKLPLLEDKLRDFVQSLEAVQLENGWVRLRDFSKVLKQFLPQREPSPKFERGQLLSQAHLESFKQKVLGKTSNLDLLADREAFYQQVLHTLPTIVTEGEEQKVEHLVEAIRLCGGDPIALLPKYKKYTDWEVEVMLQQLSDRLNESIKALNEKISSFMADSSNNEPTQEITTTPGPTQEIATTPEPTQEIATSSNTEPTQESTTTPELEISPSPVNTTVATATVSYPEVINGISDLVGRAVTVNLGSQPRQGIFQGRNGSSSTGIVIVSINGEEKKYTLKFDKIEIEYPRNSNNFSNLNQLDEEFHFSTKK